MILSKVQDKQLLVTLHSLKFNEDFKVVRAYLEQCLSDLRKNNDSAVDIQLHWNQGACQALQEFFEKIDRASERLQKKK